MVQAVLFDVIGTTVKEKNGDAILTAFEKAFLSHVDSINMQILKRHRGKEKRLMIIEVLKQHSYPLSIAEQVYQSFRKNLEKSLDNFSENDGAAEIFDYLRSRNIKLGIGTGLEREVFGKIYDRLKWDKYQFDYIGIGTEAGASRPHPRMILDMMKKLGISDTTCFLKVGDTIADIQEGKNAGVITAAILSGSQQKEDLEKESPDFLIESLPEIKDIIAASISSRCN